MITEFEEVKVPRRIRFKTRLEDRQKKINRFMLNHGNGYACGGWWTKQDEFGHEYYYRYYRPTCSKSFRKLANKKVRHDHQEFGGKNAKFKREQNHWNMWL